MIADPVDAVLLADPARELQLDQRGGDVPGSEPRRPGQLVDARRVIGQALEQLPGETAGRLDRGACGLEAVRLEHVCCGRDRRRPEPQQGVRACRDRRRDLARHHHHLPAVLEREVRRDERAGALAGLDHYRGRAEAGDDPVPRGEPPTCRFAGRSRFRGGAGPSPGPHRHGRPVPRKWRKVAQSRPKRGSPSGQAARPAHQLVHCQFVEHQRLLERLRLLDKNLVHCAYPEQLAVRKPCDQPPALRPRPRLSHPVENPFVVISRQRPAHARPSRGIG